jgi:regulator of protease activity HflC (stomatin/prohibitin superfamily)
MCFWTHGVVHETEAGVLYENGQFQRVLGPGRHRLSTLPWRRETLARVDLRPQSLLLSGQEMVTLDGVTLRLNVTADYRVTDAPMALHSVTSYVQTLYTSLQILLREEVQSRTLDALLAERASLALAIQERGREAAAGIGIELVSVGLKDVILPGEVKKMLSRELEVQRAGRAAVAAAREEVAAARARANTAQLLQSNPALMRLRELEALTEVAGGQGNTVVLSMPGDLPVLAVVKRPE